MGNEKLFFEKLKEMVDGLDGCYFFFYFFFCGEDGC